MIFNFSKSPTETLFITDAIHIYTFVKDMNFTKAWLLWKPGDPVETTSYSSLSAITTGIASVTGGSGKFLPHSTWNGQACCFRATETLFIEPYALSNSNVTDVYIPYATNILTVNTDYVYDEVTPKNTNLVYTQQCFNSTSVIHVNSSLYSAMVNNSDVWGEIISNVVSDM